MMRVKRGKVFCQTAKFLASNPKKANQLKLALDADFRQTMRLMIAYVLPYPGFGGKVFIQVKGK